MKNKRHITLSVFMAIVFSFTILLGMGYAESSKALYEQAKKEGSVTFGGPTAQKRAAKILDAFEKKYPGVKMNYVRKSSGPFATLLETEREAGKCMFDLVHSSDPVDIHRFKETKYFMKYKSPTWDLIPDHLKNKDGYYTGYGVTVMLAAYNPTIIPSDEAPVSYKDFLKPKFKGMMSNSSPSRGGTGLVATARVLDILGWDYIKGLVANEAMFVRGHGSVIRMVISGERPLCWEATGYRVLEEDAKGSPLKIIWPIEGVPVSLWFMGIPAKAPHPAAAKLLVNFLSSKEGQELIVKHANLWSVLPRMPAPILMKPLEMMNVWYPDMDYLIKNGEEIAKKFDEMYGLR